MAAHDAERTAECQGDEKAAPESDFEAARGTGALAVGDEARVLLDALPERPLPAKITFVAAKSQFTPKEVETRDERQKLVFRVKLRLTDPAAVPQAKPGMPGAGYVRTQAKDWPPNLQ